VIRATINPGPIYITAADTFAMQGKTPEIRQFKTGATRDTDTGKPDFDGFLSPLTLRRYGEYMHRHRVQPDGSLRDSDNWQRGIPLDAYMKSAFRHFLDAWSEHRGVKTEAGLEESLCALIFNASGYLHEILKAKRKPEDIPQGEVNNFLDSMTVIARELEDFRRTDDATGV